MDTKVSMEVPTQNKNHALTELLKCNVFIPEKKIAFSFHTRPNVLYNFT